MNSSFKLISLNIALFVENNKKVAQFLEEQKPDIICLQEVGRSDDKNTHAGFISKKTVDEATLDLHYAFYSPNMILKGFTRGNFHGKDEFKIDFNGFIETGNYTKSKFEILKGESVFIQNHFAYVTDTSKWPAEDFRAMQVVDLRIDDDKSLRLINYHGIWTRDKQGNELSRSACEKINEIAQEVSYPVIICGDFNLFPDTHSMKVLNENFVSLVDKNNISSTRPKANELSHHERNVVDYIFVDKGMRVDDFKVIENDVSDHLPLVLSFQI